MMPGKQKTDTKGYQIVYILLVEQWQRRDISVKQYISSSCVIYYIIKATGFGGLSLIRIKPKNPTKIKNF